MKCVFAFVVGFCLAAGAIVLDGRLDDPEWKSAKKYDGFKRMLSNPAANEPVGAETEFYMVPGKDAVYFGVKCYEPLMDKLKKLPPVPLWVSDGIEFLFVPDGGTSDYYQFLVTYPNYRFSMFYAENGKIRPDPYAPVWKSVVHTGDDFWSMEVEFPLDAFYMTRQNLWKTEWRVNVCRTRYVSKENSSWSQVKYNYNELERYRTIAGFPMRAPQDDVYISFVSADITSLKDGKPSGTIKAHVQLPTGGMFEFFGKQVKLNSGTNIVSSEYVFEKTGRNEVPISLKRLSDGKEFRRYYPVIADFVPVSMSFTKPSFRRNFYPGQDHSRIEGTVKRIGTEPVTLTLSGAGCKEQTIELTGDNMNFSFDSSSMQEGEAVLKAQCGEYVKTEIIRLLKPNGKPISWIENGNLVVDGKPVLRRNMYAEGYMGGQAFKEKYEADNLYMTKDIKGVSVGTEWVKGLETKECRKDVYPSKEYLDVLDKAIEKAKERNAVYYYMSDEPECRNLSPIYLRHAYEYLAKKDPYRVVLMGTRACRTYLDCADWFETHPYINPRDENGKRNYGRDFNSLGKNIEDISALNRPDKCIGSMPTCFAMRSSNREARYPDFREFVCNTWTFFIHGCKTLYPYAYHDMGDVPSLYEGVRYIFSSADALQDYILLGKRTMLHNDRTSGVALFEISDGRRMFAAVNYSSNDITLELDDLKGRFYEFRGDRRFKSPIFFGNLKLQLKPHEVIIGTSVKEGTDLKTYDQVSKEIDELEYKRCNTGSLLAHRFNDIEVTASRPTPRIPYEMFDGTRDVIAFQDFWNWKPKYYELSFPNPDFIPEFSRVRVYGFNVGKPTIKIRSRGKWVQLEPKEIKQERFMVEYILPKTMKTVKMRMDFHEKNLELYEIELFK